jgi:septal ring factor EnvC (AmiA/AmiB activator)
MFNSHLPKKIAELEAEINDLKTKIKSMAYEYQKVSEDKREVEFQLNHQKQQADINEEKALQKQANEMKQALITSDITREQALAKLTVYEKMDTKADANTIKEIANKLIDAIGKTNVNLLKSS